jgi:hypothetical protein
MDPDLGSQNITQTNMSLLYPRFFRVQQDEVTRRDWDHKKGAKTQAKTKCKVEKLSIRDS